MHNDSIYKNTIVDRVTTIDVSPIDDRVLTASLDETVRLWDLRSSTGQVKYRMDQ